MDWSGLLFLEDVISVYRVKRSGNVHTCGTYGRYNCGMWYAYIDKLVSVLVWIGWMHKELLKSTVSKLICITSTI